MLLQYASTPACPCFRLLFIKDIQNYHSHVADGSPNSNLKHMQLLMLFYRQQLICHIKDPQIRNKITLYLNDTTFDSNVSPLSIYGVYCHDITILRIRFS